MTRKNKNVFFLLLLIAITGMTSFLIPKHALYIGVVQIVHEEKAATATIQIKVFSDDLQSVLQNDLGYEKIPSLEALCSSNSQSIEAYFKKYLKIKASQQAIDFQLVDCEQINEVHLLSFKTKQINTSQVYIIDAPFFMELFPIQSNIVNYKYISLDENALQRMGRCTKGKTIVEITL